MKGKFANLNLTDEQKQKIHEAMRASRGDAQDAAKDGTDGKEHHFKRGEHMVHFFEIAAPILTPEQRAAVARDLRERAERGVAPGH